MIPADVASSLRLILPDQQSTTNPQTGPVVAAQKIADVLSNLVPGQRVLAEIQALLPNGNYRALVAQRDLVLSLPFSAKAGDSIELEVVESDGKLSLAFIANRSEGPAAKVNQESVPTTLSSTGKLIGTLMNGVEGEGKRAPPAQLNGNQALVEAMPKNAADLVPVLKQALSQSGIFYEAHQARWVAGQLPTEALRQEPQARFSPANTPDLPTASPETPVLRPPALQISSIAAQVTDVSSEPVRNPETSFATTSVPSPPLSPKSPDDLTSQKLASAYNLPPKDEPLKQEQAPISTAAQAAQKPLADPRQLDNNLPNLGSKLEASPHLTTGTPIPRELTPIVQQQLDGLATQSFAWQGQVWPGQKMWWEIGENSDDARNSAGEPIARWQSHLKLSLPTLGGVDAVLHLKPGGELSISMTTDSPGGESRLRESSDQLLRQFETAGLKLGQLLIRHAKPAE